MRYTKIALLTFGAGLLVGLVVVAFEIDWAGRVASSLMALGLAAVPLGMIVDWRLATKAVQRPAKRGGKTAAGKTAAGKTAAGKARARATATPPRRNARPRRPAPPKR